LEVREADGLLRHGPIERVAIEDEVLEHRRPREELVRETTLNSQTRLELRIYITHVNLLELILF
jgi:hypothetical protein